MWLGIPEYRLDRGARRPTSRRSSTWASTSSTRPASGSTSPWNSCGTRHDAVFLGIGATLGRGLDIEGGDADGVFKAIEFLINMNRGFEVASASGWW
jgi:hypothetical protein